MSGEFMNRQRAWVWLVVGIATWLACTLIFGCAPVSRSVTTNDENWPRLGQVVMWNGHAVSMPEGASAERVARIVSAMDAHLSAFEAQERIRPLPVSIGIVDRPWIPCGENPGVFAGCWCRTREVDAQGRWSVRVTILLTAEDDTVPALYHELFHSSFWGWGHGEGSPEGLARWYVVDKRGEAVVDAIRAARRQG